MVVIGLTGLARSGKDTVADILVSQFGFYKIGMADPLYKIARTYYGWNGEKDDKGRALLQGIGTIGRAYNEDVWVNHVKATISDLMLRKAYTMQGLRVVISGIRYQNEVDLVRNYNTNAIWRVIGRGGLIGDVSKHESEKYVSEFEVDNVIDNSGSYGVLEGLIVSLFRQIQVTYQSHI